MNVAKRFGQNLVRVRKGAGQSQGDLAGRSGIHRNQISEYERGLKLPRLDTLVKLAETLEVSTNELVEGIEWVPGEPGQERQGGQFREDGR